jgi:hypothetical protein
MVVTPARVSAPVSQPLFLVGAPRSGTSLVYRALSLHPRAAYISNWLRRFPGLGVVSAANRLSRRLPALQLRYWFGEDSNAYRYGQRRSVAERAFPAPVEGAPVFERYGFDGDDGAAPADADALRAAFSDIVRFGGGTTVITKRIENNGRIPQLAEVFPNARFVMIVRDGRAVAYSLSRVDWWPQGKIWWLDSTAGEWAKSGGDPWELCAREWVEELRRVEAGLAQVAPERALTVTYENLVASPLQELERIARFAGLDESPRWESVLRRIEFPNRNERWRSALPPDAVATIESIQDEELRRHGYV